MKPAPQANFASFIRHHVLDGKTLVDVIGIMCLRLPVRGSFLRNKRQVTIRKQESRFRGHPTLKWNLRRA